MKKSNRKPKARRKAVPQAEKPTAPDRRRFLRMGRNLAIGLPVVLVGGYFFNQSVQATIAEGDLSRIGQGVPTIVQVHDPQCSLCVALQKETRRALRDFDEGDLTYLVANVMTHEGRILAATHGVPHVTLLLFDGDGGLQQTIRGVTDADDLEVAFRGLLDAHG